MKSNAAGQLFGYSLQFPRALLRLLQAGEGEAVGIEICGDVSVFFPEGIVLSEEDKSSLATNALTDHSENLWKTFYNWITAVNEGELQVDKTRFVLYTNHSVTQQSLASEFGKAETRAEVASAIKLVKERLNDVVEGHALFKYLDFVVNQNSETFAHLLLRFELVVNHVADDVYEDIRREIAGKIVGKAYVEYILDNLSGWVQKTINGQIAKHQQARITFEEFSHQFLALFSRVRQQALIDFAVTHLPDTEALTARMQARPTYVKQLEIIDADQMEIMEAVSDYYRADSNRLEWIEKEIIDESAMSDFMGRLKSFHANRQQRIELTERGRAETERGQLLLHDCKDRQEALAGQHPPDRTIQGTYHVLAEEKQVGWHPRWGAMLADQEVHNE